MPTKEASKSIYGGVIGKAGMGLLSRIENSDGFSILFDYSVGTFLLILIPNLLGLCVVFLSNLNIYSTLNCGLLSSHMCSYLNSELVSIIERSVRRDLGILDLILFLSVVNLCARVLHILQ